MWGEKVKFACKVFRTEHARIPGYPLVKDHWIRFNQHTCRLEKINCLFKTFGEMDCLWTLHFIIMVVKGRRSEGLDLLNCNLYLIHLVLGNLSLGPSYQATRSLGRFPLEDTFLQVGKSRRWWNHWLPDKVHSESWSMLTPVVFSFR